MGSETIPCSLTFLMLLEEVLTDSQPPPFFCRIGSGRDAFGWDFIKAYGYYCFFYWCDTLMFGTCLCTWYEQGWPWMERFFFLGNMGCRKENGLFTSSTLPVFLGGEYLPQSHCAQPLAMIALKIWQAGCTQGDQLINFGYIEPAHMLFKSWPDQQEPAEIWIAFDQL